MKKLFIIRHAKSDWSNPHLKDFDRPLNHRGNKNVPFMGKLLKNNGVFPDLILSSPALRAVSTAKLLAKEINYKNEIELNENIYETDYQTLLDIIRNVSDKNKTVFIIGHNPGLSNLVDYICPINLDMPTCAIVELDFNTPSWESISKENATLASYEYPKKYK
jgi:phosphohistidine phosphatase